MSGYHLATHFLRKQKPKGLGEYPQQVGDATMYMASKASACQTTILLE